MPLRARSNWANRRHRRLCCGTPAGPAGSRGGFISEILATLQPNMRFRRRHCQTSQIRDILTASRQEHSPFGSAQWMPSRCAVPVHSLQAPCRARCRGPETGLYQSRHASRYLVVQTHLVQPEVEPLNSLRITRRLMAQQAQDSMYIS